METKRHGNGEAKPSKTYDTSGKDTPDTKTNEDGSNMKFTNREVGQTEMDT